MRLYAIARVAEVENSDAFRKLREKAATRSAKSTAIAKLKADELVRRTHETQIDVPIFENRTLYERATAHYNELWIARGRYDKNASVDASQEFLDRIAVNYLRHVCSRYEDELDMTFGKIGGGEARDIIRNIVYTAIAKAYPYLVDECRRQQYLRAQQRQQAAEYAAAL